MMEVTGDVIGVLSCRLIKAVPSWFGILTGPVRTEGGRRLLFSQKQAGTEEGDGTPEEADWGFPSPLRDGEVGV